MSTDREKTGLKGPVKEVLIETVQLEVHDGQIAEKPWFSHMKIFNRDGQLIEEVYRNSDGSESRAVHVYSDSGNLLATRGFDSMGTLGSEMRYIYDAKDRLTAEQHVTPDGKVTTSSTYTYDDMGRKLKIQELDSSGTANLMIGIEGTNTSISASEASRVESRYDDRGEVVEVRLFNTDGALVSRMEITRDERGNSLEETQYVGDVFPLGACASDSCSTQEMATLTEEQKTEFEAEVARLFSPGSAMSKHVHRYDTEGRLIESKLTMMGMDVSRQTFAYDELGNRSEEVIYNENETSGQKAVFEREYDNHGNWTKELVSTASSWDDEIGVSTPSHLTRRHITYW
jgi:YD repeat-containing protein